MFALDDFEVRPGKCPHHHDYVYTFEPGLEDLELEKIQPTSSRASRLESPSFNVISGAPKTDHTTRSKNGFYYLFMNTADTYPTTYIDTLSMTGLPEDNVATCVRFAFQSSGNVTFRVSYEPENDYDGGPRSWLQLWQLR